VWLGIAVVVATIIFWVWVFSGAPRRINPDRLQDRAWVESAEATCAATMEEVDARAAAGAGTDDLEARGDAIDANTDDLEAMLASLRDPPPEQAGDRDVVEEWLGDWDQLIEDRRAYADAVRVNPDARFLTIEKFNDPLDRVVQTFAEVNEMPSCAPAGDVG